jgi:hypothetical protein
VLHVPAYPGEESFPGVVSHIGDLVGKDTRTVKIRCTVENKDHRLKPEMFTKGGSAEEYRGEKKESS